MVFCLSCGSDRHQIKIGPKPEAVTKGTLVGPLCQGDRCNCRKGADDAGLPEAAGVKRFEIQMKSAQELWVTLAQHQLYKDKERAVACFYLDLAPGKHALELRASNPDGVSAELEVHELGTKTKSWYETFKFSCGHPGVCSFEALDNAKTELHAQVKGNLYDACGSTKIRGLEWDHGKAPDGAHPSELLVRLALDIYKFEPDKKHGDATCGPGDAKQRDISDPEPADDRPATPNPPK
jgi:hypothetical protein